MFAVLLARNTLSLGLFLMIPLAVEIAMQRSPQGSLIACSNQNSTFPHDYSAMFSLKSLSSSEIIWFCYFCTSFVLSLLFP